MGAGAAAGMRSAQWGVGAYSAYTKAGFESAAKKFNPKDTEVDMTGKRILITGANSGIGFSTAQTLASKGAEIHMLCRNEERGKAAAEKIRKHIASEITGSDGSGSSVGTMDDDSSALKTDSSESDSRVHLHLCDLSDIPATIAWSRAFADELSRQPGGLYAIVNNAGTLLHPSGDSKRDNQLGTVVYNADLFSHYVLTQTLFKSLVQYNEYQQSCVTSASSSSADTSTEAEEKKEDDVSVGDSNGGKISWSLPRVINVSSGGMYNFFLPKAAKILSGDWNYDWHMTYAKGKAYDGTVHYGLLKRCQVALTRAWSRRWTDQNVMCFSMHPGWADTPAVQSALPSFREKLKGNLRDWHMGADTIVWLCMHQGLTKEDSGKFYLDRQSQPTYLTGWSGTDSSTEQESALYSFLETQLNEAVVACSSTVDSAEEVTASTDSSSKL